MRHTRSFFLPSSALLSLPLFARVMSFRVAILSLLIAVTAEYANSTDICPSVEIPRVWKITGVIGLRYHGAEYIPGKLCIAGIKDRRRFKKDDLSDSDLASGCYGTMLQTKRCRQIVRGSFSFSVSILRDEREKERFYKRRSSPEYITSRAHRIEKRALSTKHARGHEVGCWINTIDSICHRWTLRFARLGQCPDLKRCKMWKHWDWKTVNAGRDEGRWKGENIGRDDHLRSIKFNVRIFVGRQCDAGMDIHFKFTNIAVHASKKSSFLLHNIHTMWRKTRVHISYSIIQIVRVLCDGSV